MTDLIRYDLLAQDALRGVVRKVLSDVAKGGLLGEHHFFIDFDTCAEGVKISNRMKAKYPEKMTIVLQHQFWDLDVGDESFSVGLSFGGVAEKLVVPFESIKGFYDPSVHFGLQFETVTEAQAEPGVAANEAGKNETAAAGDRRPAPRGAASEPEETPKIPAAAKAKKKSEGAEAPAKKVSKDDTEQAGSAQGGAQVLSLDKFRKK